ncbi:MAG: homoserine O-succinyltransferase, partial [Actinomycetota bacterium]|nr:homoserine O-succinyltransferase [Actinomycetota bacterium]
MRPPAGPRPRARTTGALAVAIVNNMPDAALRHTRRQFSDLVREAVAPRPVEVREYTLPGLRRSPEAAAYLARNASPVSALLQSAPDAVIVTGAEPVAARLEDETYFADLVRLLEWSAALPTQLLLSCLAAHAALLAIDGVRRERLPAKLSGVFDQDVDRSRPGDASLPATVPLPHSRLNDVPTERVRAAGYEVLVSSPETGWSIARGSIGRCEVLLSQGHPEYDGSSLLREYRRDVERHLAGESPPPVLPSRCVAPGDEAHVGSFHRSLLEGRRPERLDLVLPVEELASRAPRPWHAFS